MSQKSLGIKRAPPWGALGECKLTYDLLLIATLPPVLTTGGCSLLFLGISLFILVDFPQLFVYVLVQVHSPGNFPLTCTDSCTNICTSSSTFWRYPWHLPFIFVLNTAGLSAFPVPAFWKTPKQWHRWAGVHSVAARSTNLVKAAALPAERRENYDATYQALSALYPGPRPRCL